MMGCLAAILVASLFLTLSSSQDLQSIRLVNGTDGDHMGRVEVLYNGTWGSVCGDGWNYNAARATCKQLGWPWAVCFLPYTDPPQFGSIPDNQSVWINNVMCVRSQTRLDECSYNVTSEEGRNDCGGPAQVYCQTSNGLFNMGTPYNITQTESASTAVTMSWEIPPVPVNATFIRHQITFRQETVNGQRNKTSERRFLTRQRRYSPRNTRFSVVIHSLLKNATYTVRLRTDVKYLCRYSFLFGNVSQRVPAQTNAEARVSTVPIRLVPPVPDAYFMGRVEVLYNNTWGTVCDDGFSTLEANVICQSLNFTSALCYVREAGMGRGTGPIWMDNVDCSRGADEVLEDCSFNGWGNHNCGHDADIGVVCLKEGHLGSVTGLSVDRVGATSLSLSWNAFQFPPVATETRYRIKYSNNVRRGGSRQIWVDGSETTAVLSRLTFNYTYTIQINARFRYQYCTKYVDGGYSESVEATTAQTAPTAPPTSFHVIALNSTALEFQWGLPVYQHRNGWIRGYKLFLKPLDQDEQTIVVRSQSGQFEYVWSGLSPNSVYTCSVLAFTIDDGPRSVSLTVLTMDEDFVPMITGFGLYGNGFDRATVWRQQTDIRIHCDVTNSNDVSVTWYREDGTAVGTSDRNLRQVGYQNGTTALQIASNRLVSYCDAGVYTCVVNDSRGVSQSREFTLLYTDVPPRPSSPYPVRITSTSVTISWDELACDGGHTVTGFTIRYRKTFQEYITLVNMYIYNVAPSNRNYTIINLEPYTPYNFSVQTISSDYRPSAFSLDNIITTATEAPSPPRSVQTRVVAPYTVEVSWTSPAEPNGIVTKYTVYGTPRSDPFIDPYLVDYELPDPLKMVYSGSTGAVNITVPQAIVTYEFKISATVVVGGNEIEGEMSAGSTIYVPYPDIPAIENARIQRITNSTIAVTWDYPMFDSEILGFQVTYNALVEWRSKNGVLVTFSESKVTNVSYNTATVTALTPGTEYNFFIAILTQSGPGRLTRILATTGPPLGERLAYFQLMLGPIDSCTGWQAKATSIINQIHSLLLTQINTNLCPDCQLVDTSVQNDELSCREVDTDSQAVYRARIIGTDSYSASYLVQLLREWVMSGQASIVVDSTRLHIDTHCETLLDNPLAPDCTRTVATTSPPTILTTTDSTTVIRTSSPDVTAAPSVEVAAQNGERLSGGAIGGLVLGVLIAVLLIVFILLLVVVLTRSFRDSFGTKRLVEEQDVNVFTDSGITHENLAFDSNTSPKDDSKGTDL